MLRWIAFWPHRIVTRLYNRLAMLVHNQRTEWMTSVVASFTRQLDRAAQENQIMLCNLFSAWVCHGWFIIA
jgi:hypothetical protein